MSSSRCRDLHKLEVAAWTQDTRHEHWEASDAKYVFTLSLNCVDLASLLTLRIAHLDLGFEGRGDIEQ